MKLIALFFSLWLTVNGFILDDPCVSPNVLGKSLIRDSSNKLPTTLTLDGYLCDDVIDGWYRFEDAEISTSCVDTFHCSKTPVWMNDTVPTLKDGILLKKFCVNTGTSSDCCGSSFHTEVKNCGLFRVYNLKKVNIHCPMAYCTDYTYRCKGKAVCNNTYPRFSSPTLIGPNTTGSSFTFSCDFSHAHSDSSAVFDVIWKFDNQTVRIDTVSAPANSSSLNDISWIGHLGQELSCSVRSYFTNLTERVYSPVKDSSSFYGGIRVNPSPEITLMEGREKQLTLISSLPILCGSSSSNCSLSLRLVLINNETLPGTDLLFDSCGVITLDSSINQGRAAVKVSMPMNLIGLPQGRQVVRLEATQGGSNSLWTGHIGQDIVITTNDVGHNQCTVFGDGNIDGFNKTVRTTNVARQFDSGDYIMYKADVGDSSDLQIQVRMHLEKGNRASMCGVAIQYGGEVVTIDMCSKVYNVSAPYLTSTNPGSKAIDVFVCDSSYYMIYTADDVSLEVRVHEQNLEVNLQLPPSYSPEGLGVCSYSTHSDDPLRLVASREKEIILSASESYFADGKDNLKTLSHTKPTLYCRCEEKLCSTRRRITDYIVYQRDQCKAVLPKPDRLYHDWDKNFDHEDTDNGCQWHGKLVIPNTLRKLVFQAPRNHVTSQIIVTIVYDLTSVCIQNSLTSTIPIDDTSTVGTGIVVHQNKIKTHGTRAALTIEWKIVSLRTIKSVRLPLKKSTHTIKEPLTNLSCSITIERGPLQDLGFLQAFLWSCQDLFLNNRDMYIPDSTTGLLKPTPVLSTYLCPDFCSLHGQCVDGKCQCDRHYTGKDCSMTIWAQPEILDIIDGSVCGDSIDDCSVPLLITRNIMDGDTLMATVKPISFTGLNGVTQSNTTHSTPAVSENKYSVSVNLTAYLTNKDVTVRGFQIMLLSSGNISNSVNYVIADTTCLTCSSENLSCTIKSSKCFIDNRCFYDGDRKQTDFKLGCDPSRDQRQWTPVS